MFLGMPMPIIGGKKALRVQDVFQTALATGAGLQSALDAALPSADLIFAKDRAAASDWIWRDTARGMGLKLASNSTAAESAFSGYSGGNNHVGYALKQAPRFHQIITFTGDGVAGRQIPHSLGVAPGMIVVKRRDAAGIWSVYHRSRTAAVQLSLESNAAEVVSSDFASTEPTDSHFSVGLGVSVNTSGGLYVAYLFVHDPSPDGVMQCGSYVGNGSAAGPVVTLGWQPQYLMVKNATGTGNWRIFDAARGIGSTFLYANLSNAEVSAAGMLSASSSGFQVTNAGGDMNTSGQTYIYMAIRAP